MQIDSPWNIDTYEQKKM